MKIRFPLLNDRHTHISFYAALGAAADLSACTTEAQALAALRGGGRGLLTARGWKNNFYDLPASGLDRLGPVAVCNVSLHSFRVNAAARRLLRPRCPAVIDNIDDQDWVERHLPDVFALFAAGGGEKNIPAFMDSLAAAGVWAAADMLVSSGGAARLLAGRYAGRAELWASPEGWRRLGPGARRAVRGIKLFADGALGARTAATGAPYKGGGGGILLHSDAELARLLKLAGRLAGRAAVHAIGGLAVEQVLRVLESLRPPRAGLEVRMEHAQLISYAQARRAKRLGVKLCMQPNFSPDSRCYADRLPARLARANNPFRMLIDRAGFVPGEDLLFGSDGMPHGAQAALECALFPPLPGQRLTPEEFRAGYCLPDMAAGFIEADINTAARRVRTRVRLAGGRKRVQEL